MQIGIAGIGFMGMIHFLTYQKVRGVKVAALCETAIAPLALDFRASPTASRHRKRPW